MTHKSGLDDRKALKEMIRFSALCMMGLRVSFWLFIPP